MIEKGILAAHGSVFPWRGTLVTEKNKRIGKLERAQLTDLWSRETAFSRWLSNNIEELNEAVGIELSEPECEASVGDFSADLVAESRAGNRIIIENQFGRTDHDHLGKLLTYLTGTNAAGAIWIVERARPEHVEAVTWLNEKPGARFWLVKLDVVRISDSPLAPLFTVIVEPGEATEAAGEIQEDWAERQQLRYEFFRQLLDRAKETTDLHAGISPSKDSWVSTSAGKSGLYWVYRIRMDDAGVELAIDSGDEKQNKNFLHDLEEEKEAIESEFGAPLEWDERKGRRACYIRKTIEGGGYRDPKTKWIKIQDRMIDAMTRLESALADHLRQLEF